MTAFSTAALDQLLDELADRVARRMVALDREHSGASENAASSPWMAIERAAAYLDLPKQRLYRLTAGGEIPHYKQEGRLLFHRGELDAWLGRFCEGERSWLHDGAGS